MEGAGDNGVLLVAMGTVATLGAPRRKVPRESLANRGFSVATHNLESAT